MKWGTRFACLFVTDNWVSLITYSLYLIKIRRILLVWERLVGGAFFELILAFYLRDLSWGLLYPKDEPKVRTTLYSLITYWPSQTVKVWKKSVRWHVSRLRGLLVDRFAEALSEEPFHIFVSEPYDSQTIKRPLPFLCSFTQAFRVKSKEVSFSSTTACASPVTP